MNSSINPLSVQPWTLEPESEYRFELDPGEAIAIKVCSRSSLPSSPSRLELTLVLLIWFVGRSPAAKPRCTVLSLLPIGGITLLPSARLLSSHGKGARSR